MEKGWKGLLEILNNCWKNI